MRAMILLAVLLAGCASTRPCAITDEDDRELNIGMACSCSGDPIQTMTCKRIK